LRVADCERAIRLEPFEPFAMSDDFLDLQKPLALQPDFAEPFGALLFGLVLQAVDCVLAVVDLAGECGELMTARAAGFDEVEFFHSGLVSCSSGLNESNSARAKSRI